jgi:hypothetical protein
MDTNLAAVDKTKMGTQAKHLQDLFGEVDSV